MLTPRDKDKYTVLTQNRNCHRIRSGSLQADLSLIVWSNPSARVNAQATNCDNTELLQDSDRCWATLTTGCNGLDFIYFNERRKNTINPAIVPQNLRVPTPGRDTETHRSVTYFVTPRFFVVDLSENSRSPARDSAYTLYESIQR